jgi:hypothetical protein
MEEDESVKENDYGWYVKKAKSTYVGTRSKRWHR